MVQKQVRDVSQNRVRHLCQNRVRDVGQNRVHEYVQKWNAKISKTGTPKIEQLVRKK